LKSLLINSLGNEEMQLIESLRKNDFKHLVKCEDLFPITLHNSKYQVIIMELAEKGNLYEYIQNFKKKNERINYRDALDISLQISLGI
jgi:hypothetical protein